MNQTRKYTIRLNMFSLNSEERSHLLKMYCSGTLALSIVLLPSVLSLPNTETIQVSLIALSIALPTLSGSLVTQFCYKRVTLSASINGIIGMLCSIAALTYTLWHFSPAAAISFVVAAIITSNVIEIFLPINRPKTQPEIDTIPQTLNNTQQKRHYHSKKKT